MDILSSKHLAEQGQRAYQNGDYDSALMAFEQAAQSYSQAGDNLNAAEMKNNLSVVHLQMGNAQAALDAVENTAAIFEKENDPRRHALALGNEASAREALNQLDEALALYQRSANMLGDLKEKEMRATVLKSISAVQLKRGKPFDAVSSMRTNLDEIEKPTWTQRLMKKLLTMRLW
jgi:tetratricopeptide (TPR) repeat protein